MFRIITVPFSLKEESFSDKELNDFVRNKQGVSYQARLIQISGHYYWSVFLHYEESLSAEKDLSFKYDYEQLMYSELKKWRNARAEKEGIPPYIIFTNNQLKEIVISKCNTKESLKNIEGIGDIKSKNYGDETIKIIKSFLEKKDEEPAGKNERRLSCFHQMDDNLRAYHGESGGYSQISTLFINQQDIELCQ
jgi:superfamily II DNA helicase RecQ